LLEVKKGQRFVVDPSDEKCFSFHKRVATRIKGRELGGGRRVVALGKERTVTATQRRRRL